MFVLIQRHTMSLLHVVLFVFVLTSHISSFPVNSQLPSVVSGCFLMSRQISFPVEFLPTRSALESFFLAQVGAPNMDVDVLKTGVWFEAVLTDVTRLSVNQRCLDSALKQTLEVGHFSLKDVCSVIKQLHA